MGECFAHVFTTQPPVPVFLLSVSAKEHVTHEGVHSRKKADYAQIRCMDVGRKTLGRQTLGRVWTVGRNLIY